MFSQNDLCPKMSCVLMHQHCDHQHSSGIKNQSCSAKTAIAQKHVLTGVSAESLILPPYSQYHALKRYRETC